MEKNRYGHLASYAYYKSFFDRISANMAFLSGKDKGSKKPNYNKYYKNVHLIELYKGVRGSKEIINEAQRFRNKNPLIHASSELLENNNSSKELKKMEKKLNYLIDSYSHQYYEEWLDCAEQN